MGTFTVGSIVLIKFPFSDLSGAKLRPAILLAYSGNDDWILCQITSNPYSDATAIEVNNSDFKEGSLKRTSYIRPGKLFTGNKSIIDRSIGTVREKVIMELIEKVVVLIQGKMKNQPE